ncbi:MAG: hypothetical protein K6U74_19770, partial [Firmicutes bacterium]|nr:hypothetical protein [Bacillota bacterium]
AEKRGHHISFVGYMKVAFPLMLMSILVSTAYLLAWYFAGLTMTFAATLGAILVLAIISKSVTRMLSKDKASGLAQVKHAG